MKLAPIVVFVYSRLWHTQQTIESLKRNNFASESELYIFSDAPKNEEVVLAVGEVRNYLKTIDGFKKITIIERERNLGLAKSIIDGVTKIVNEFGRIIVLEDDLVTSPSFLTFMNKGLELYKDDENVASIHGYVYPIKNLPQTFFIKGADCWGWATWDRAWRCFEPDGKKILKELKIKKLEKEANFNNSFGFSKMLKEQIKGKVDSWAIRWSLSVFLENMLTLYPSVSYVQNIGNDDTGTHCSSSDVYDVNLSNDLQISKIVAEEDVEARKKFEFYFNSIKKNKFRKSNLKRIVPVLKSYTKDLLPPILIKKLRDIKNKNYGWKGNYNSWEEATKDTGGYDDDIIINKVKQAVQKVKDGDAVFERDSVVFNKAQYSWPLISALVLSGIKNSGNLSVVDFGGSLGSTYYQNLKFLKEFNSLTWSVIEQEKFVKIGKSDFSDEYLKFYFDLAECLEEQTPNVLLLSSVLQYIESPYSLLKQLLDYNFEYIIIDRTPFSRKNVDEIKMQIVPKKIYEASYPCWFFDKSFFVDYFNSKKYSLFEEFDANDEDTKGCVFRGMIFKKND